MKHSLIAMLGLCGVFGVLRAQDYPPDPPPLTGPPLPTMSAAPPPDRSARKSPPLTALNEAPKESQDGFRILGRELAQGTSERLAWSSEQSFVDDVSAAVLVTHGRRKGPVLCLTGAVHGDELNGIEVVRRILRSVTADELRGTLIGVPIVNMAGFTRGSRYLPDRRDLNRFFPGSTRGSSASRIAHSFFQNIIRHCDYLVDFHTGSFERSNLPQVRGDLRNAAVLEFSRGFGATVVLHTPGAEGMLRRAATDVGIPALTFEIGAPVRLQPVEIELGVRAIETLLNKLKMVERFRVWREPQPVFYDSRWVRASKGGFLFSDVALGTAVQRGQRIGKIIDPITNEEQTLRSPFAGRILGMALNQVVMPGFAAFHVGDETTEAEAVLEAIRRPAMDSENQDLEEVDSTSTRADREEVDSD